MLIEVKLDRVKKRLPVEFATGMSNLAGWFVNGDQPWIFIDDFQRHRRRYGDVVWWTDQSDADEFVWSNPVLVLDRYVVHCHATGFDHSLQPEGRVIPQVLTQKCVDPFSAEEGLDYKLADRWAIDATNGWMAAC